MRSAQYLSRIFTGLAGIALLGGIAGSAPQSAADQIPLIAHARVAPHRADDGSLRRGPHNEVDTSNWSGYEVANFQTGETYTAASASWTVPKVSYVAPPPVCHTYRYGRQSYQFCSSPSASAEYSSSWVGIGGFCENANCTSVDNSLIQLGTEADVSSRGQTQYYAWIEMLPEYPILISASYPNCNSLSCAYPVKPGDAITASLTCQSGCATPGANQTWLLTMSDATEHWNFAKTVSYSSSLLSAVWIQEAPSSTGGVLPLADFGTVKLDPINGADGVTPTLSLAANAIQMIDPYGETANPSAPDGFGFAVCWGNNANSIAACPAP